MPVKIAASQRGGVLGSNGIIDVGAATNALKRQVEITVTLPATTQNQTTNSVAVPVPHANGLRFVRASYAYGTAPAVSGGTCTLQVQKLASDGTTATALDDTVSALSRTNNAGFAGGAAVSGVTVAQHETVRVQCVTSNNVVGTPAANGVATLLFEPIEATVIDQ